jgi:plastocyanin
MSSKSRTTWYIVAAIIIIVIVVGGVLAYEFYKPPSTSGGGTQMDIYASDTPSYGFGNSAGSITSPGPTMTFTSGQTYTVTLHNVGTVPHNWAIVTDKTDGSTNLAFSGAQIGSASNPVAPGSSQSKTFTVGSAGSYYYICQVDSHVTLGMWGNVTVNP